MIIVDKYYQYSRIVLQLQDKVKCIYKHPHTVCVVYVVFTTMTSIGFLFAVFKYSLYSYTHLLRSGTGQNVSCRVGDFA